MSTSLRSALLVVSLMLLSAPGVAQDLKPANPEDDRGWITFGPGYAIAGGEQLLFGSTTANFGREHVVQVGIDQIVLLRTEQASVNLSYGRSIPTPSTRTAAFIGPAIVWGDVGTTLGIEVSGQAHLTPIPEFGLGLELVGNLNLEQSSIGLAVVFVFDGNK